MVTTTTMRKQVEEYVGKKALYRANLSLIFEVKIIDVRRVYGRDQYLITPTAGDGQRWVEQLEFIK